MAMNNLVFAIVIAVGYLALAGASAWIALDSTDISTLWLASGLTLGALAGRRPQTWPGTLIGAAIGAGAFAILTGSAWPDVAVYALIEVVAAAVGAGLVLMLAGSPLRLDTLRSLWALILGGVVVMSVTGGVAAAAWQHLGGEPGVPELFRSWLASNFVGSLLIAPAVVAWLQSTPGTGDESPLPFAGGAIAFVLFVAGVLLIFVDDPGRRHDDVVTFLPLLPLALVALLWGVRGATLAAISGASIAVAMTERGSGPFAADGSWLGDPVLEAQACTLAIALTALLVAVLVEAQRMALRSAREWQARVTTAIDSHNLIAYEWDPRTGSLTLTGDAPRVLGFPAESVGTLDQWLQRVPRTLRDDVSRRFETRKGGEGYADVTSYPLAGADGSQVVVSDEARAVLNEDGTLYCVAGFIRRVER